MAQFFVYDNINPTSRERYPYLLDIQSNLLSELRTTLVIPLMPANVAAPISMSRLNPMFDIDGAAYVAITQDLASIDRSRLGAKVKDFSAYHADIVAAIDFVLAGI